MHFIWRVFWFRVGFWVGMVICSFLLSLGLTTANLFKPETPPIWVWPCVALSAMHAIIFAVCFVMSVMNEDLYD